MAEGVNYVAAAQNAADLKEQAMALANNPDATEADMIRAQELMQEYSRKMTAISEMLKTQGEAERTAARNSGTG